MEALDAPSFPEPVETASGFFAEFRVQVEPRVLVASLGKPRKVVALDELGQSLASPEAEPSQSPPPLFNGPGALIHLPLVRPHRPSRMLKTLSGVLPMKVGLLPKQPSLVVPLDQAAGKTFRAGDVIVDVQETQTISNTSFRLKLTARIAPSDGPASAPNPAAPDRTRGARLVRQIEIVDAAGNPVNANGSLSQGDTLSLDVSFFHPSPENAPKQLRIYATKFVTWDAPFTFADVPLP